MRGVDATQEALFSTISLDARVPQGHPLRKLRVVVNVILETMSAQFDAVYAAGGRPSIPPERLFRALLLQALYSIRSERALMERLDFDLLFRWFVGLGIDEKVWERTVFSANRERLLNEQVAREFFRRVVMLAEWRGLVSDEHFSVDGTLIEAWASHKSFVPKGGQDPGDDEPPGGAGGATRNEAVDFRGVPRSNDTHASTTDPEARLYKKSSGVASQLCYLGHALSENRNGLVVDAEVTLATGRAEREAALRMLRRTAAGKKGATLGADKGYDVASFVRELKELGIKAHVARKKVGSAIDGRTARGKGYQTSLRVRKRIEEVFGWAKTVGGLRKTRFISRTRVAAQTLFTFAAYNLTRLSRLWGWREAPG
jgi:transposase